MGLNPTPSRKTNVTLRVRNDYGNEFSVPRIKDYNKRDCTVYLYGEAVRVELRASEHDKSGANKGGEQDVNRKGTGFSIPFASVYKVSAPLIFGRDKFSIHVLINAYGFVDPISSYDSLFRNVDYAALERAAEQEKRENAIKIQYAEEATRNAQESADRAYAEAMREYDNACYNLPDEQRPAPPTRKIVQPVVANTSHHHESKLRDANWARSPRSKEKFNHTKRYLKKRMKETKISFKMPGDFKGNKHDECVAWKNMLKTRIMQL